MLGHVERGLGSASLLSYDTALTLDRLLNLFHLTTFAYLSGLLSGGQWSATDPDSSSPVG